MILAVLSGMGGRLNVHPDFIARFADNMNTVAREAREREKFASDTKRALDANRHQDMQQ